ncbi:MAG: hypothetical protein EOP56_13365 [Sphingobacteriales bacterium]|nr:MAG: hypothetical protein EOP56_13365 [Sphingobacteriales bacterium]
MALNLEREIKHLLKLKGYTQEQAAEKLQISRQTLAAKLSKANMDADFKAGLKEHFDIDVDALLHADTIENLQQPTHTTGEEIRRNKAVDGSRRDALKAVPIRAQAGYAQHFMDPVYLDELQRFDIPGLPYAGDRFRVFQVSGDSMEVYNKENQPEGLRDGMWVIAKKIDPEYWHQTFDFFVHVIVTPSRIMIKRLKREKYEDSKKGDYYFVAISDNEDVYPQFTLDPSEIEELWEVERKIDWNMAPPKRFEIKVKR